MLIVLTSEQELENEADKINTLFKNGLKRLHLRKPFFGIERYRTLLEFIDKEYYQYIMIHQYHELCKEFNLRGIHIQEQPRVDLGAELGTYVSRFTANGYKVSSSFHSIEDIKICKTSFEYVMLSPIFSSISKAGYKGRGFDVNDLDEFVIGMGGINEKTIKKTFELGFRGVGVLGGIWNAQDYLESFIAIRDVIAQEVI